MAMQYIVACQVDSNCVVEAEHSEDEVDSRSLEKGGKLWGLKIGLAFAFLAITVVSSFIPLLFKRLSSFKVCTISVPLLTKQSSVGSCSGFGLCSSADPFRLPLKPACVHPSTHATSRTLDGLPSIWISCLAIVLAQK